MPAVCIGFLDVVGLHMYHIKIYTNHAILVAVEVICNMYFMYYYSSMYNIIFIAIALHKFT